MRQIPDTSQKKNFHTKNSSHLMLQKLLHRAHTIEPTATAGNERMAMSIKNQGEKGKKKAKVKYEGDDDDDVALFAIEIRIARD